MIKTLDFLLHNAPLPVFLCFLITLIWILIFLRIAPTVGLISNPGDRRDHAGPTPLVGGIAFVFGFLPAAAIFVPMSTRFLALIISIVMYSVVAVVDDRIDLRWRYRISAQIIVGVILFYYGGVRIESIGSALGIPGHSLGILSAPFTVLATIGLMNALNMADGIDGLAAALTLAALAMLVAAAIYAGNSRLALTMAVAIGGVAAVLVFNLRTPWNPRARIFLGGGSEILGLVVAWGCFRLTQTPGHPVTPVLAPFLIAPPVIDCLVLIVRRIRAGRSPFAADSNHLHHLLHRAGFSTNQVVAAITGATLGIGLTAALVRRLHLPEPVFVLGFLALCAAYYLWSVRWEGRQTTIPGFDGGLIPSTADAPPHPKSSTSG